MNTDNVDRDIRLDIAIHMDILCDKRQKRGHIRHRILCQRYI